MLKIPLTSLAHQPRGERVSCSWNYGHQLTVLETESIPERINDQFVASQADKRSWFVSVYLNGELILELPPIESRINFHYVQMLDNEHILLVGARCHYNDGQPEKNAAVYDSHGQLVRSFTLGDGIEDINVTSDGAIWASYFDEGVFGNYGWAQPIGQYGLVKFDATGQVLWQADKFQIFDCYAVNAENEHSFWFYYYSDFKLVHLKDGEATSYNVPIQGAHAFALCHPYIVMGGGYGNNDKFSVFKQHPQHLKKTDELRFTDPQGKNLHQCIYSIRGNQVVAYEQHRIYFTHLALENKK
ncbi:hypothetical protein [Pragia fontium]|uniref:hypothetical protein n=1 Tax=Pragia fontium TaxID=82985 RepID=UPI00064B22B8|nr:hypothetical protein [Pragia fontium]AKJ42932.1 hypothetical protein QQ39_13365 [Pragia fontium]